MNLKRYYPLALLSVPLLFFGAGCSERDPSSLDIARAKINPWVFDEAYAEDVYFQAFQGTYLNATSVDSVYAYESLKSLMVAIPPEGSVLGAYSGGVLTSVGVRDLADFNALTFHARCGVNIALDVAGFGNDNTGTSLYEASRANIPLTSDWTPVVIPIPNPTRLVAERGLFTFAEELESGHPLGYQVWFDDIKFDSVSNIANPRPVMPTMIKYYFVGSSASLAGTYTVFNVAGSDVVVNHSPAYFDFHSSDPAVAMVAGGAIKVIGVGDAVITATLGDVEATGSVTLSGYLPPTTAPARPTWPASSVIAMLGPVYQNVPVDSWNPHWQYSTTEDANYVIGEDVMKLYSSFNFVGIVFTSQTIDVSAMTHLHLDVYAPAGTDFKVKIVPFDQDNGHAIGSSELTFNATTTPAFAAETWSSLDIPLDAFRLTVPLNHIGQLVLSSSDARLVLIDNLYWYRLDRSGAIGSE